MSAGSPFNVRRHLRGSRFPASKRDLMVTARGNRAPDEVIDTLDRLPDREFGALEDVMDEIRRIG